MVMFGIVSNCGELELCFVVSGVDVMVGIIYVMLV